MVTLYSGNHAGHLVYQMDNISKHSGKASLSLCYNLKNGMLLIHSGLFVHNPSIIYCFWYTDLFHSLNQYSQLHRNSCIWSRHAPPFWHDSDKLSSLHLLQLHCLTTKIIVIILIHSGILWWRLVVSVQPELHAKNSSFNCLLSMQPCIENLLCDGVKW